VRNIFVAPRGAARLSDPTAGLHPGLFSFRPYDCAMLLVQVKEYGMIWNLDVAIWKEPVGRLEDCDIHGAPNTPGLHNKTEGADDQQH
jgi:hypothetical protein